MIEETNKENIHDENPAVSGEAHLSHEETLYAEPIFSIGSFPVTNSLINSWLAVFIIAVLAFILKGKIRKIPGRIQGVFEVVMEKFLELFDSITHSRKKTYVIAPIVLSFFFFILINNWLGILPGIGSVGFIRGEEGHQVFVPLFRGGTADLNTTLALAAIGVAISHIFGVISIGVWKHFNKFINIQAFLDIPKKIKKDPSVILVNPIKAFVGLVEVIGEIAKVASLSFRLFGNIFAGEVLLATMSAMMPLMLPIPFMALEIAVGLIQAMIFMILILVYMNMNSVAEEH